MTYAVPVFVTDSAPSSCGEQRSGAAIVGTQEAAASVRDRTLCGGAHCVVTSVELVAYVAANPGRRLCEIARVFGLKNKAMGTRLYKMRDRGCLETQPGSDGDRTLVWFATGKAVEKAPTWRQWTDDEKAALVRVWHKSPRAEVLAAIPTRSWEACIEQAHRMNLKRKRNIGRDMVALQMARNPKTAHAELPPVTAPAIVRKAIARLTPLEAAWMGRLAA